MNNQFTKLDREHGGAVSGMIPPWKRSLDLFLVVLLLPGAMVLMAMIAILIKVVSRGSVFFVQERVGLGGRTFRLFKFRTMHPQADARDHVAHCSQLMRANAPMHKLDAKGDKRLIPGGLLLRASGLDELPQLFNVWKGEMSIVGPRPCTTYEYELYTESHRQRCNALPGLTGLWQVSGKNRTTFKQMIALDVLYAKHASLWLDCKILALTVPAVIGQILEHLNLTPPPVSDKQPVWSQF